jgi:enoyl-CoA hydratase/carnithine racemase
MSCQLTLTPDIGIGLAGQATPPTGGEDMANTGSPGDTEADDEIVVTAGDGVRVVTLNRPAVRNAMTATMARTYAAALRAADDDPAVRAIVVTGAGTSFCAGADLAILREGATAIREFLPERADYPLLAYRLRKPVIAALNGPAIGIGVAYALGSDIRIAAESATLATLFSRMGLVAEYGLSWQLPRLVGLQAALDLLLSGRSVGATEAASLGLVHRVVPDGTTLDAALDYAKELAAHCSPASLAAMKAQVYADMGRGLDEAMADALARMDASFDGPDLAEALTARASGRPAVFRPLAT